MDERLAAANELPCDYVEVNDPYLFDPDR